MVKINPKVSAVAVMLLWLPTGCTKAPPPPAEETARQEAVKIEPKAAKPLASIATTASAPTKFNEPAQVKSAIIRKADVLAGGKPACKIDFVYEGFEPEDLYWDDESCANVQASLVDQAELQRLGKWKRLDEFERRNVNALPGGKVLYVEGKFTASIYPVGTTRLSYEVSVAD